jgi:Leucine-rich repeat (LRR) protein
VVPQLTRLWCEENQLTELDLSGLPQLIMLDCRNNQLSELDIRPLTHLVRLEVDDKVRIIGNRP